MDGRETAPLSQALGRFIGREVTSEELADTRRRLSQIAEVLAAIQARNAAGENNTMLIRQPAQHLKIVPPGS